MPPFSLALPWRQGADSFEIDKFQADAHAVWRLDGGLRLGRLALSAVHHLLGVVEKEVLNDDCGVKGTASHGIDYS